MEFTLMEFSVPLNDIANIHKSFLTAQILCVFVIVRFKYKNSTDSVWMQFLPMKRLTAISNLAVKYA